MQDDFSDLRYRGNICISGLTAAGKTTHSHLLAGEFGLTYVSGSQIQLNFMGVSPIQSKDFWITDEAKRYWNEKEFARIDSELLRLEGISQGYVFDTSTMPWRHRKPALCIWLRSDLKSRITKAIVSHRSLSRIPFESYQAKVEQKDATTLALYNKLYGINIGTDLSCFDLILDINSAINEPTLEASMNSIALVHDVIRPAVGWYLTGHRRFRRDLEEAVKRHNHLVIFNNLIERSICQEAETS